MKVNNVTDSSEGPILKHLHEKLQLDIYVKYFVAVVDEVR
jgi:hypothetical protein